MINLYNDATKKIYPKLPLFLKNICASIADIHNEHLRYGKIFEKYYSFLKKSENFSLSELIIYQNEELKCLIKHCYENVPYYIELFREMGITPDDINSVEDLKKLPILTKETVIKNREKIFATNYKKSDTIPIHTSGSSGKRLNFWVSKEAWQKEYAFVWARRYIGFARNEKILNFSNSNILMPLKQTKPPFWVKSYFSKQVIFSQYHINNKNLKEYVKALNDLEYEYIIGFASTIYILANYIYENNIKLNKYPNKIFTSSATIFDYQRILIEQVFNCKIFDSYGSTELASLLTQCKYGKYHINYEYGITELKEINRENDEIQYEIISTGFLNKAFPLLRYKIGDYVSIKKEQMECKCGNVGPTIERINGRVEDIIITPSGNKIGQLAYIYYDTPNIKEGQIIQEKLDELTIKIVKRETYSKLDEDRLLNKLKNRLGDEFKYNLVYIDKIPRDLSGKFRGVISKLGNQGDDI